MHTMSHQRSDGLTRRGLWRADPVRRTETRSSPRPWTRWAVSLALALTGVYNLLLALDNARHAEEYRALGVSYPPLLRAALALAWGAAFVTLSVSLVRRERWVWRWGWAVVSNYGVFSVLWIIVFAESEYNQGRIGFQTVLTAVLAVLAIGMLRWRRVRGDAYPAGLSAKQPVPNAGECVYDQQHSQD
jgi:hypothetical protein